MHDEHNASEDQLLIALQRERIDFLVGVLIELGFEAEELLEATATA